MAAGNAALCCRDERVPEFEAIKLKRSAEYESLEVSSSLLPRFGSTTARAAIADANARKEAATQSLGTRDSSPSGKNDQWSCKAKTVVGPYPSAGKQVTVARTQTCAAAPCYFAIASAVTSSMTLTQSTDRTIANGFDFGVSVTAGVTLPVKSEVQTSLGYKFAYTWSKRRDTSTKP
jgi:hypothetical protein